MQMTEAGAHRCRRCINSARRAQCSARNKGEERKRRVHASGGGGGESETSGFAIRFVSGVAARNRSCKQRRIISRFSAVLWPAYELSRLGLTAMNLRVAIDVAFRPRAVRNRGCPPRFAVRFPPGKPGNVGIPPSLSLSLETSRDDAIDGRKERERKEHKRRQNVGKVVKIVTGRAIDTRRDKRLATFARVSAPQESSESSTIRHVAIP